MTRDNAYADVEKQYIGQGIPPLNTAQFQRPPHLGDDPQPFHTFSTVYEHLISVLKQAQENHSMVSSLTDKVDGYGAANPVVERTKPEPRNVVEAYEELVSQLESTMQSMYQQVSTLSRRIL